MNYFRWNSILVVERWGGKARFPLIFSHRLRFVVFLRCSTRGGWFHEQERRRTSAVFIKCLFKWLRDFFYLVTTAEQGCGEKRSSALLDHFFSVFSTPVFRLFRSFQHFPQRIPLPTLSFFARGNASMMKNLSCCLISPSYHLGRHLPCALRDCFSTALCPWRRDEAFPPLGLGTVVRFFHHAAPWHSAVVEK